MDHIEIIMGGPHRYPMPKLVAELGAAFLRADLELTPEPRSDHAAYIQSWLKVLKEDMGTREQPRAPTPAEIEAIARYLGRVNGPEGVRPVTADVQVLPAVIQQLPIRLEVSPDTPGVRAAVEAAIRAFMAREAQIGERLSFSRLSEAISGAPGEDRHFLMEPARDVQPGKTTLLVPGPIIWVSP